MLAESMCAYRGWVCGVIVLRCRKGDIPQESRNSGSVNLTIGNRRRFCAYTACETMLRTLRPNGNLSITSNRNCRPMMLYISRIRSFLASTVCSSTSSER